MFANFQEIITRLEKQKAAIDSAIATLRQFDEGEESETPSKRVAAKTLPAKKAAKKRTMSAEGRKAIGDAVRRRWAAKKKAAKKTA